MIPGSFEEKAIELKATALDPEIRTYSTITISNKTIIPFKNIHAHGLIVDSDVATCRTFDNFPFLCLAVFLYGHAEEILCSKPVFL